MNRLNLTHFIVCLFFITPTSIINTAYAFPGTVVKITDGDTLTVETVEREQIKIRLYGIDCPEKKQPFGRLATEKAQELTAAQVVEIEIANVDRYGRTVGIVTLLDETTLQARLLDAGLAWVYPQYCERKEPCADWQRLEDEARQRKTGLWSEPEAIPPWNWRKGKR